MKKPIYINTTPLPSLLELRANEKFPEIEPKGLLKSSGKTSNLTLAKMLQRVTITFTIDDSLKYCPHCGKVRNRKHTNRGPMTIDLEAGKLQKLRIIYPRVSNNDVFWNTRWIRRKIATPSYEENSDWYYVKHEVACSTKDCPGNVWHEVEDHSGFRKFNQARLKIFRIKSFFWPDLFVLEHP